MDGNFFLSDSQLIQNVRAGAKIKLVPLWLSEMSFLRDNTPLIVDAF